MTTLDANDGPAFTTVKKQRPPRAGTGSGEKLAPIDRSAAEAMGAAQTATAEQRRSRSAAGLRATRKPLTTSRNFRRQLIPGIVSDHTSTRARKQCGKDCKKVFGGELMRWRFLVALRSKVDFERKHASALARQFGVKGKRVEPVVAVRQV